MKKMLFVAETLNMNGANKSLISLLASINCNEYEVDLFLYQQIGPLIESIPSGINLLPEISTMKYYEEDLRSALAEAPLRIKLLRIRNVLSRLFNIGDTKALKEELWFGINPLQRHYDIAIGYCEGSTHSFVLKKTNADIKVGWIHVPITSMKNQMAWQKSLCKDLDYSVAVSEDSRLELINEGIEIGKVKVIHNLVSPDSILHLAEQRIEGIDAQNRTIIVTVGRISPPKNIDGIIDICDYLVSQNIDFQWLIVGGGNDLKKYVRIVRKRGLNSYLRFTGSVNNPYPYIKMCDIYVQPSRFEGWGLAITEAKILLKPIVASDIDVFREQIKNGVNGVLCPIDTEKFGKAIIQLQSDNSMRERIIENLSKESFRNESEVEKLYELIK